MSGGDDFCALSMCKGTDRDGAASPPACSLLSSACTRGTQHHTVPGSGKAARNPAHANKVALLALAWKQSIGFWGYNIRPTNSALNNMYSVQPFCDCTVTFFFLDPV